MKYLLGILIVFFSTQVANAQETNANLLANFQLTHFINKSKDNNGQFIPVSPGVEVLYKYSFPCKWAIASGINYTYCRWQQDLGPASKFKYICHELYLPFLLNFQSSPKSSVTIGSYPGWLIKGKALNQNKLSEGSWVDMTEYVEFNESRKFILDFYIDYSFEFITEKQLKIVIAPFLKYKTIDNWLMKDVRSKLYFGLNLKCEI